MHTPLGPGLEFDAVRAMLARYGASAVGVGDDCAFLESPAGLLCLSTDSSVENVHFRREWLAPDEIGYRAAAAALSDLAAVAAEPLAMLVTLALPSRWRAARDAIADGLAAASSASRCPIVGGDTTQGGDLAITITVLGTAQRPLRRGGAREGDALYVTGTLGGPGAAVRAWYAGELPDEWERQRFARPMPRIREARWLAANGASAAIDISDGLASDLAHLAAASGVCVTLDVDRVPRRASPGAHDRAVAIAAAVSGEEYELAVTTPADFDCARFEHEFGVPLRRVGQVARGTGVDARFDGSRVDLPPGYDHFSG